MSGIRDTAPKHFQLSFDGDVALVRLDRPERKNPLTFESYAELRDWFRDLHYADDVGAVVFASICGFFFSVGVVLDIIGALLNMVIFALIS
ncbi:MAG: enoyl-CoA hydratase-related protein, partial [Pseudomonadota bacterium]